MPAASRKRSPAKLNLMTTTYHKTTASQAIDPRSVAESILGHVEWQDGVSGFCQCPGGSYHTHGTAERHCRVTLDGAPTVFCFHTSCLAQVEAANHALRSAIAKGELAANGHQTPRQPTPAEIAAIKERERCQLLKARAKGGKFEILDRFATDPAELWETSPVRLTDGAANDWRWLLRLFHADDVVWIGAVNDSCADDAPESRKADCRKYFRTVAEWLALPAVPGQFTCPSVFKCGVHSRGNANVLLRRFLVIESDSLNKAQICAVFSWCRQFLRLRAMVDTAGRSLHGWFDAPGTVTENELKVILPEFGCDPALFKLAQPCRLPGAKRDGGTQALLYLDVGGAR